MASQLIPSALVALEASGGQPLSELAQALNRSPSSVMRALRILERDRVLEIDSTKRYHIIAPDIATHLRELGLKEMSLPVAVAVVGKSNPTIEFVAADGPRMIVVLSSTWTAIALAATGMMLLERIAKQHSLRIDKYRHDDVRRKLLEEPSLRRRMASTTILHGNLDRTFPDRSGRFLDYGRPLGTPHPNLRIPSKRALGRIKHRYRLASMRLFGSAVRSDFRPDSDIDLAIKYIEGVRPRFSELLDLEEELEKAFDRDVDIVNERSMKPTLSMRVEREAVPL
ncbi:MAG: nucleotidyltransferase family protein [Candidatus Dormibacteraceae bacterium]